MYAYDNDSCNIKKVELNSHQSNKSKRGRPAHSQPKNERYHLVHQSASRLAAQEWGDKESVVQAAILAVEHCAANLGACERLWLRDAANSQQTYARIVREVVKLAASQRSDNPRMNVPFVLIERLRSSCLNTPDPLSSVGQGRQSAPADRSAAETLDRSDAKPLLGSSKQRFEDCHPARGLPAVAFDSICIDNERMQTSLAQEGGLSPCHISPQALSRTEVTSTRGLLAVNAYDNDSYQ